MAYTKQQKHFIRGFFNQGENKPQVSLADHPRTVWDDEAEAVIEFGFVWIVDDLDDDEINELLDMELRRDIPSYMYWDCTGCLFTYDISWHRNPNGAISFVHRMYYDN